MRNTYGNDKRGVMKFLREVGIKPTVGNVERMQREVSRSQTENERAERIAKETGRGGLRYPDTGEDAHAKVKAAMKARLASRDHNRGPR